MENKNQKGEQGRKRKRKMSKEKKSKKEKAMEVQSAGSSKDYFKVAVLIPTIDHLLSELEFRFSQIQVHAARGMYLIPKNLQDMSSVHRDNIFQFFEWALPSPQTFNQELDVWKQMWHDVVDDAPDTLQTSLAACEQKLFPNIFLCYVPIDGSTS